MNLAHSGMRFESSQLTSSYSGDESLQKNSQAKNFELNDDDAETISQVVGQNSLSTLCGDTVTGNQSNDTLSQSHSTITSNTTIRIAGDKGFSQSEQSQIQSSKSMDLNNFSNKSSSSQKHSQPPHSQSSQLKQSKIESKNFQILQQSNTKNEDRRAAQRNDNTKSKQSGSVANQQLQQQQKAINY